MKIQPRGEWLVIKPVEESQTINGLYVPATVASSQYKQGKIVEVSGEFHENTVGLKVDDLIVYDNVGAVSFRLGNEQFVMLKGREVLGKVIY